MRFGKALFDISDQSDNLLVGPLKIIRLPSDRSRPKTVVTKIQLQDTPLNRSGYQSIKGSVPISPAIRDSDNFQFSKIKLHKNLFSTKNTKQKNFTFSENKGKEDSAHVPQVYPKTVKQGDNSKFEFPEPPQDAVDLEKGSHTRKRSLQMESLQLQYQSLQQEATPKEEKRDEKKIKEDAPIKNKKRIKKEQAPR